MQADKNDAPADAAPQVDATLNKQQESQTAPVQKEAAKTETPATKEPKKKAAKPADLGEKRPNFMFSNSNTEFMTYTQPVVKKVFPTMGLTKGGTPLELSGAWFD